jgi:excisionase family DNA binding protein
MKDSNPTFLKPIEFAAAIGASKQKVYEAISRGQIPSCRVAGLLRIPRKVLDEFARAAMAGDESESAESD